MTSHFFLSIDKTKLVKEERIMLAALKVFATYPFAVATVRMIAEEAGLTVSAIMYHYKSKENLYEAVFDRLAPYRTQSLEHDFDVLSQPKIPDHEEVERMFIGFLGNMIEGMYNSENPNWYVRIIFFELLYPSPLFDTLYEKYFKKNYEIFLDLVKRVTGNDDHRLAVFHTSGILGYMMSFRMQRECLVRQTDLVDFNANELAELKENIINHTFLILNVDRTQ